MISLSNSPVSAGAGAALPLVSASAEALLATALAIGVAPENLRAQSNMHHLCWTEGKVTSYETNGQTDVSTRTLQNQTRLWAHCLLQAVPLWYCWKADSFFFRGLLP